MRTSSSSRFTVVFMAPPEGPQDWLSARGTHPRAERFSPVRVFRFCRRSNGGRSSRTRGYGVGDLGLGVLGGLQAVVLIALPHLALDRPTDEVRQLLEGDRPRDRESGLIEHGRNVRLKVRRYVQ